MTREANRLIAGKQVRHLARNLFRKNKRDLVMSTREALQRCSDKILADQNQMATEDKQSRAFLTICETFVKAEHDRLRMMSRDHHPVSTVTRERYLFLNE